MAPLVTKANIIEGLTNAGLSKGDTAMVHSSLKAFGRVEHGADDVIDALLDVVGEAGTIVMPTFTYSSFGNRQCKRFDVAETPSEVGYITEVFRKRPKARRSVHVTHSVAAIGPNAETVLGEGRSPWGQGSTFARLIELNAWNLLLGVGFEACTALHCAEELQQVPYRDYQDYKDVIVVCPDGRKIPSQSQSFLASSAINNDFGKMLAVFQKKGILRIAHAGNAIIINARIRHIVNSAVEYLKLDPDYLLNRD